MASPTGLLTGAGDRAPSPPHLVSLVLQSKKGLQHGEQLCSRAHDLTRESAREAVDALALDAKIRWIAAGVVQQLKMAAGVAKSIAEQRTRLEEEAKVWDRARAQRQDALDATLESLGAQLVPPSFHQTSLESSLFGIQHADDDDDGEDADAAASAGGEAHKGKTAQDRSRWRTLRDFVDERSIEDVVESLEEERNALDDAISATAHYPDIIADRIARIREMLPPPAAAATAVPTTAAIATTPVLPRGSPVHRLATTSPVSPGPLRESADRPQIRDVSPLLAAQERASAGMASHLESLAAHYDQMATALKEKEAGETLEDEDMEVFIRDTAELPSIIAELEEAVVEIESVSREISEMKYNLQCTVDSQSRVLDSLDALGEEMETMLKDQAKVETETQATYETLNDYLETLVTYKTTYETYQMSYNSLLLEMDRRRRYRDAMDAVIDEMRGRLDRLREDEIALREAFYAAHAASIPDDLCLAISNLPESYTISTSGVGTDERTGEEAKGEVLPEIDGDLVAEARRRVEAAAASAQDMQDAFVMPVRPGPQREDSL